jgi:hypothetical protein
LLYHFDFRVWFRLLRLAFAEPSPRGRRRLLLELLFAVPAIALFHAVCFALDWILFPSLRRQEIRTPVFVIGHARSGTTLLHRLLALDRERFSCFLLWELYFPSLLQKKALRALARLDARLGGALARRVAAWDRRKFAATNDMHRMSFFAPEEDDFVLTPACASGWWIVRLPYLDALDFYYVDEWPERRRRRLLRFYRECVRRQLAFRGGELLHLSKNPTYCGRVESLIEAFPDARIVVTLRNPTETIPSLLKLLQRGWQIRKWSDAQMASSLRAIAAMSFHNYEHPQAVLARHPETLRALVDYRELVAAPRRTLGAVCAELGLPVSGGFAAELEAEEQRARRFESAHAYSLDEFGLDEDAIRRRLAPFYEEGRWEAPAP